MNKLANFSSPLSHSAARILWLIFLIFLSNRLAAQPEIIAPHVDGEKHELLKKAIANFEQDFTEVFDNQKVIDLGSKKKKSFSVAVKAFNSTHKNYQSPFFENYKRYRFYELERRVFRLNSVHCSKHYFLDKKLQTDNPAYLFLFQKVYKNYLREILKQGFDPKTDDINSLKNALSHKGILFNDGLKELIILEGLREMLSENKPDLMLLLDLFIEQASEKKLAKSAKKLKAQQKQKLTIVKGKSPSRAGDIIDLQALNNLITKEEVVIAQAKVQNNGDFAFYLQVDSPTQVFISLPVFKGILYVQPHTQFTISLPRKVEKKQEDQLNPFFKKQEFFVRILKVKGLKAKKNELNTQIIQFDKRYSELLDKNFYKLYRKNNPQLVNKITAQLENEFEDENSLFFKNYKTYKLLKIRLLGRNKPITKIIESHFSGQAILFKNSMYMSIFRQVFESYFSKNKQKKQLEKITKNFTTYNELINSLDSFPVLKNTALKELFLLNHLHQLSQKSNYSGKLILPILTSIQNKSQVPENKQIAAAVIYNISYLKAGFAAPDFELRNADYQLKKLSDFRGKFVYLNFGRSSSFNCQEDWEMIKSIQKRELPDLEIISIFVEKDFDTFSDFTQGKGYSWHLLHAENQSNTLKKYKIKAYPVYFLIAPDGTLISSPSRTPKEDFELYYLDMYKKQKNKKLREQHKKKTEGLMNE